MVPELLLLESDPSTAATFDGTVRVKARKWIISGSDQEYVSLNNGHIKHDLFYVLKRT
jgi:hypothetical protein